MMKKAANDQQKAIALTDHGNMFGVYEFVNEANKNNLKPILGCEFYLVANRHKQSFSKVKGETDVRYHQLLLAKNQLGYQNLSKLCSLGFIEGMYGKYPRIDKELIEKYHEGIIATSCCIGAEIPQAILQGQPEKAEQLLKWWLDIFGEDYYIELQRHRGLENIDNLGISQEDVNQTLLQFAKKYNLKVICTNDSHYIEEEDARPHEILLCVNTGNKMEDPDRFKFPSSDFYFKTQAEMSALFADVPEALDNTIHIFDKIENFKLERDILLPNFPIQQGFSTQSDFLKHLVYEGAKMRYGAISEKVKDRLDFELQTIKNMGFDGYFLVVQDFIKAARKLNVAVGPGRGSAAGSAVAYCLTITNIDPIKYNLLFERFLNPERVSMPDIDIDFDDIGRQKVIDYVVEKYGRSQVAQIVTFGTMAARSSIKDVARVMGLPLADSDRLAKLVPSKPGTKLYKILEKPIKDIEAEWQGDDFNNIVKLRDIATKKDTLEGEVLGLAKKLEGSVRNTGIHAAGVIIAPDDITQYIPVCTAKDADLYVTQVEGTIVESAGMLKMDFLGLKTLTIIRDAIENIVKRYGEKKRFHPDDIPLDDEATFELFQRGEMIGIFQFESDGMQKYLKELKPTSIEDLIAMNALYRPGPMDYIPTFIRRKHGVEKIEFPHPWLEEMLQPTNGIMVYQEQIMQTAQIMADYTLGQADMLRRAMGKKKLSEMQKQRETFQQGAAAKGVAKEKADEIFDIMEKFASYGFNRSHAAAYSVVAFQTAYLKTHYPAEFMASVLTHNKDNVDSLNFFLHECKRMGITVLCPDINESEIDFTVNKKGQIRFGLSAIKGVGEGPVEEILRCRKDGQLFKSIFDLTKRTNLRAINKRVLEGLVWSGAFDCFEHTHRAQYFAQSEKFDTFIEHALKFGNAVQAQKETTAISLFGDEMHEVEIPDPTPPTVEPWSLIEKLNAEKDVTGIYLSGHPLDDYLLEVKFFTNGTLANLEQNHDKRIRVACIVAEAKHRISKKGTGFGTFVLQDYESTLEINLFGEDYQKFKHLFEVGQTLLIQGVYQMGWRGEDYELKISEVNQLASVTEKLASSMTIKFPLELLNPTFIGKFENICKKYKGKYPVKIMLIDTKNTTTLQFSNKNVRLKINNEILQALEQLGNVAVNIQ